jgi:hypothetical protein
MCPLNCKTTRMYTHSVMIRSYGQANLIIKYVHVHMYSYTLATLLSNTEQLTALVVSMHIWQQCSNVKLELKFHAFHST